MGSSHDTLRNQISKSAAKVLRSVRLRKWVAFVLCAALLANTVSVGAFAAGDAGWPSEEVLEDSATVLEGAADEIAQNSESVSGGDAAAVSGVASGETEAAQDPEDDLDVEDSAVVPEVASGEAETARDPESVSGGDAAAVPEGASGEAETAQDPESVSGGDAAAVPEGVSGEAGTAQNPESVSGSDAAKQPQGNGMDLSGFQSIMTSMSQISTMFTAADEEKVKFGVTVNKSDIGDTLNLSGNVMSFLIAAEINGSGVTEPILKISIPSYLGITKDNIQEEWLSAPVSTDTSGGNTILTYKFKTTMGWVKFTVGAEIANGYKIKDGEKYAIKLDYYDGTTPVKSIEKSFTTNNPTVKAGGVKAGLAQSFTIQLQENVANYYSSAYGWNISASSGHYPYQSLKVIVPLPEGAEPGLGTGDAAFSPLKNNESYNMGQYKLTYSSSYNGVSGKVLIYEITDGTFLTSGNSFSLSSSSSGGLYLRYTSPKAGSYRAAASPRIECTIDGKTVVMQDFDTNSNYNTVTIKELSEISSASLYGDYSSAWSDIIYLKNGVSIYDTKAFAPRIVVSPTQHVSYDKLKVSVKLPDGAVPGFGTGNSFQALGARVENGDFYVSYNQGVLEYEIKPGAAILSSDGKSYSFVFSGTKELHLRFSNPQPGKYTGKFISPITLTRNGTDKTVSYSTQNLTVTVLKQDKILPVSDYEYSTKKEGWSDTIQMKDGTTVYYTREYVRTVYAAVQDISNYRYRDPYDWVKMTVLLPDEATPGFGTGDAFRPLANGTANTISSSYGTWNVTYYEKYGYTNEAGVSGTGKALVYELNSTNNIGNFLSGSVGSFTFGYPSSTSKKLYLRFENPQPNVTYSSAASPRVECSIKGEKHTSPNYFKDTAEDTKVEFTGLKVDWSNLRVTSGSNKTPYIDSSSYTYNYVLPEEYQSDKEYYGYIKNTTGYTLKDVEIAYTFDESLNVDRLEFNLDGAQKIVYTTKADGNEKTFSLNGSGNVLSLGKGDAFLTATLTYNTLESSADQKKILTAGLHNYDKKDESGKYITATIVSAGSDLNSGDAYVKNSKYNSASFALKSKILCLTASVKTTPTQLSKWDEFTVTVTTSRDYYSNFGKEQNLSIYLRMPKGYVLTDYTPNKGCEDGEYKVTSRILGDGTEDILYCLEYTDNVMYEPGKHTFSFQVGLEADTYDDIKTISLPVAVYASTGEGKLFQFSNVTTEEKIGLDVNGDGDEDDSFYRLSSVPSVDITGLGYIGIAGYLSVDGQAGEASEKEYSFNSTGTYRCVIYNGLDSSASVSDTSLLISLHKAGDKFKFDDEDYISQHDALLNGPVRPEGDFWDGCTIQYSINGTDWLSEGDVKDYTQISFVRLQSAADKTLEAAQSAYLKVPFSVRFTEDGAVGDVKDSKAYISARLEYNTGVSAGRQINEVIGELKAKSIDFSGTIYQDKNWNGKRDADESSNDKAYTLKLYSGKGTEGKLFRETTTNAVDGSYSIGVLLPGTYTLHVEKDENEDYGESMFFDADGNYTFDLENGQIPVTKGLDMGIKNLDIVEKPEFVVVPDVPDGKDGWYITLPQISFLPSTSSVECDTIFWHDDEAPQKLTEETQPSVEGSGVFAYNAYNTAVLGNSTVKSDTAVLELKVDVDAPIIKEDFSYSVSAHSVAARPMGLTIGNFLPFGNFFSKALEITIMVEDAGSGVDALYYTLPGEEVQSVEPDEDGYCRFEIPMDTVGKITYYVEDKAGNKSDEITLKKGEGSELWMIEDRGPVWEEFVLTDMNGNTGVQGVDGGIWFAGLVNVFARVTDEESGIAYISSRVNEEPVETQKVIGDEKKTAYEFTTTIETEGVVTLWAEAEDDATNISETQTSFGIDRTPPIIVLKEKMPMSDSPTATVLLKDVGSGIDPDSIHVLWQGEEVESQLTPVEGGGYQLTFSIAEQKAVDEDAVFCVNAKDYTGWSTEFSVTRQQKSIIYVAAYTGSDETGNGSRTYPFKTLGTALERVMPGGTIVLLEDYDGTAYVNLEVTLDLNGKVLCANIPGSAVTVGPSGSLTITDSNGAASAAEGFKRDPKSEGEVFGGNLGDPAFALDGGFLCLADGTIYCGYVGNGSVEIMDDARMMYLLTYLSGGGTGDAPGIHYIEENTMDALKENTFSKDGYEFQGWLYDNHLYDAGQKILMPGRNMEAVAKWAISDTWAMSDIQVMSDEMPQERRGELDQVPKTGDGGIDSGETDNGSIPWTDRMELYTEIRKKENEQSTED